MLDLRLGKKKVLLENADDLFLDTAVLISLWQPHEQVSAFLRIQNMFFPFKFYLLATSKVLEALDTLFQCLV